MKTFAQRLKQAREAKYDSASRFAGVLGLDAHAYRKYERGDSEPNYDTLTRICELLDITPNDLFPLASTPPKRTPPESQEKQPAKRRPARKSA